MIDVAAAKAWIKKETDDEDALIAGLVNAAIATLEAQTGKFMSAQAFVQELAIFPSCVPYEIRLSRGPVAHISEIEYDPSDGSDPATIADFRLIEGYGKSFNGVIRPAYGEVWPATLCGSGVIRISGTAGYEDGEASELDQAALMLVAHWFQNREAVSGSTPVELPLAVKMLISPYRPSGLA